MSLESSFKKAFIKNIAFIVLNWTILLNVNAKEVTEIKKISAKLFYNHDGNTSKEMDNKKLGFKLWNTGIGEGFAKYPSNDTLIDIEFSRGSSIDKVQVEAIVTSNKKVILSVKRTIYFLDKKTYHLPLLVNGTECTPITVRAGIVGQKDSYKKLEVPFACGE